MLKLGIIMVNYFRWNLTKFALETLNKTIPKEERVIIVIDNNSPDESQVELVKMMNDGRIDHVILNNENRHLGSGVNQGLDFLEKNYEIEYLLWCGQDFFAMDGWYENAMIVMEDLGLDFVSSCFLEGLSNDKILSSELEITERNGRYGFLKPRGGNWNYDVGTGLLMKFEHFIKNHIRCQEKKFGDTYIGPQIEIYKLIQENLNLKGVRLAKPSLLLQDPEFNNPEYIDYYRYIHGIRSFPMEKTYRNFCRDGYFKDVDEYYKGTNYEVSEWYLWKEGMLLDYGWSGREDEKDQLERWK